MSHAVDLTDCDLEPIHIPGSIQPFGAILAMSSGWIVRRASANAPDWLGRSLEEILGSPLAALIDADALHAVRGRLQMAYGAGVVERLFGLALTGGTDRYDVAVHVSGAEVILEFEPSLSDEHANAATLVRSMIGRVEACEEFSALVREAARQVRGLTGFDRVMVYRFDDTGAGEVVGESVRSGAPPFLGLRYPASDIPQQARALYERNLMRLIADVDGAPCPILPELDESGQPLDLSMSMLRSASPIHIEYLRNMGVRSSMSISLLQGGRLWGLIACHHSRPLRPSFDRRSAAELFGQMLSYLLESRLRAEDARYELRVREIQSRISSGLAKSAVEWAHSPVFHESVREMLDCDGVGVCLGGKTSLHGATPSPEEFEALVRMLNRTSDGRVLAADDLGQTHPPAQDYAERAAGMLAIPISRRPRDYVVAFRREAVRAVTWAGDPTKPASLGPNGVRLTPRKSFEAWREIVQGRAEPWTAAQQRAAESLRVALMEVVLQLTDVADAQRQAADKRQQILIAELNHRVRNILGLVRGVITQSSTSAVSIADLTSVLEGRVQSMARAHDQLTARRWDASPLRGLIEAEVEAYLGDAQERLVIEGPEVGLAPQAFTAVTLVIHELTTNAVKYGALSRPSGRVEVNVEIEPTSELHLTWREVGGPPVLPPERHGFGSTIIEQVIPFELRGESGVDYRPTGVQAFLRIPASLVHRLEPRAVEAVRPSAPRPEPLSGAVLLLEDNLFIAIDAEEMLTRLGAATVTVARSVDDALDALRAQSFTFALLDVNLGGETSLPAARRLKEAGVPFAFGTGYGDGLALPPDLEGSVVLTKPYSLRSLRIGLAPLSG
ncbi:MAG: HWE histidine kinase domain-containing protein [Phenylobacterium sp.]|uniref:HWE histidine kinase domain-containing protein n=1 Tax=Phenylobacterium sp. TaxID=1871053 RepID=UPI00391BA1BC